MTGRSHGELGRFTAAAHDQLDVPATNRSALGSDEIRSVEMGSDKVK